METFLWTLTAFFCGSIPFALLVGWLATGSDIRAYGDHNPGATNVLRASNWRWFALALLLDYLKGALPVGIPYLLLGIHGWRIVPIAFAPLLGHAFSPWLRGRGGKTVATTFGVWSGLTLGAAPITLAALFTMLFAIFTSSGWTTFVAMLGLGGFVAMQYASCAPELLIVWALNVALIGLRHRSELSRAPRLRIWIRRWVLGAQ
jgi:glycerol-3-phosphate acyltransferase PlsY